jgi:hypothetical protein
VTGEQHGQWFKLTGYGLHWNEITPERMGKLEVALAAAWEALAGLKST